MTGAHFPLLFIQSRESFTTGKLKLIPRPGLAAMGMAKLTLRFCRLIASMPIDCTEENGGIPVAGSCAAAIVDSKTYVSRGANNAMMRFIKSPRFEEAHHRIIRASAH